MLVQKCDKVVMAMINFIFKSVIKKIRSSTHRQNNIVNAKRANVSFSYKSDVSEEPIRIIIQGLRSKCTGD